MAKATKRCVGDRGAKDRDFLCPRCGNRHRNRSKEQRECRAMYRNGEIWKPAPTAAKGEAEERDEATRYTRDPFRGNSRHHLIAKKAKENWPARKIAKFVGLPVKDVKSVIERAA